MSYISAAPFTCYAEAILNYALLLATVYATKQVNYNIKSNNYLESLDNFESPAEFLDIMSQRTLALTFNGNEFDY